jgi:hypothetical protein
MIGAIAGDIIRSVRKTSRLSPAVQRRFQLLQCDLMLGGWRTGRWWIGLELRTVWLVATIQLRVL